MMYKRKSPGTEVPDGTRTTPAMNENQPFDRFSLRPGRVCQTVALSVDARTGQGVEQVQYSTTAKKVIGYPYDDWLF
jgi:hypothetical protein